MAGLKTREELRYQVNEALAESPELAALLCAAITLLLVGGIMLRGAAGLRNWAPICGIRRCFSISPL